MTETVKTLSCEKTWKFSLIQGEMEVASVEGDYQSCLREINHYAMMYAPDGPITIKEKRLS